MPGWYLWVFIGSTFTLAIALLLDPLRRWRSLALWPIPTILGVWLCAILACQFPAEAAGRSWGMALYASVFIAAQVLCWSRQALRFLALASLATILLIATDLWFQGATSRSLIRETRWPQLIWLGYWNWNGHTGSLANVNDHAVLAVLLPLCLINIPTRWTWGFLALGFCASVYDIWVIRSRQMLLGILGGLSAVVGLHAPRKVRWWAVAGIIVLVGLSIVASPGVRDKLTALASSPLAGRSILIAYGLALFREHPLFGIGPSLYGHYYTLGVREGWSFRGESLGTFGIPWVHCLPAEIACELGLAGLVGYAIVLWAFIGRIRMSHAVPGASRDLAIAVAGSALAMALMGLVDLTFIKDWVRICWWLLLGLGFGAPSLAKAGTRG